MLGMVEKHPSIEESAVYIRIRTYMYHNNNNNNNNDNDNIMHECYNMSMCVCSHTNTHVCAREHTCNMHTYTQSHAYTHTHTHTHNTTTHTHVLHFVRGILKALSQKVTRLHPFKYILLTESPGWLKGSNVLIVRETTLDREKAVAIIIQNIQCIFTVLYCILYSTHCTHSVLYAVQTIHTVPQYTIIHTVYYTIHSYTRRIQNTPSAHSTHSIHSTQSQYLQYIPYT